VIAEFTLKNDCQRGYAGGKARAATSTVKEVIPSSASSEGYAAAPLFSRLA